MHATRWMIAAGLAAVAASADAMPNFVRREGFDCATCHTTIPRLNRFGYEFRNAGFRVPSMIGDAKQKEVPDLGTMFAARLQSQPSFTKTRTGGKTTNQGQLSFFETTIYPLTGSFGRWWSSEGEISFAPEDFFEVENAYLRATFGGEASHANVRLGVFHPWEGYGASDRPLTINRTLFQGVAARFGSGAATSTFFTPWGFDQVGLELGYTMGGFNVAGAVLNGLFVDAAERKAQPFQGGGLSRPTTDPNYNAKDYQLFANQFFGDAALSAHYYHGTLTIPVAATSFTDRFDRLSLYGTLPVPRFGPKTVPPLWLLAGYELGWDTGFDAATSSTTGKFRSSGWFAEVFSPITPSIGAALRYDRFDPSRSVSNDTQQALVAALSVAALNGAQGILEYRHRLNEGAAADTNTDELRLRVIYIF
jgi:hypothetical protein